MTLGRGLYTESLGTAHVPRAWGNERRKPTKIAEIKKKLIKKKKKLEMRFPNLGLETERYVIQKMRLYALTKASTQTDD